MRSPLKLAWIALATAVAAALLWTAYVAVGSTSPAVWMAVACCCSSWLSP